MLFGAKIKNNLEPLTHVYFLQKYQQRCNRFPIDRLRNAC